MKVTGKRLNYCLFAVLKKWTFFSEKKKKRKEKCTSVLEMKCKCFWYSDVIRYNCLINSSEGTFYLFIHIIFFCQSDKMVLGPVFMFSQIQFFFMAKMWKPDLHERIEYLNKFCFVLIFFFLYKIVGKVILL